MKYFGAVVLMVMGFVAAAMASQIPPDPVCSAQFRVVACAKPQACTLEVVTPPLLVDIGMVGAGCPFKQGDQIEPVFVKAAVGESLEGTVQWGGDGWGLGYTFVPRVK